MKLHQLTGNGPIDSAQSRPTIAREQSQPFQGLFESSISHSKDLPDRRIAEVIVLLTVRKACCGAAPFGGAKSSIMMKSFLRKGSCCPTLHPCVCDRNPINSPGAIRNVTPDVFKELP